MNLDGKEIICKLKEKEEAKAEYAESQARGEFGGLALLKDDDAKILQFKIGTLLPNQTVEVSLIYLQQVSTFQDQFCYKMT